MDRFLEAAQKHRMWGTPSRLCGYARYLYQDVPLEGMRLLDIGGQGVFSPYAAASGASRVLCLEPEGAGSLKGKRETLQQVAAESGVQSVETLPLKLQAYDAGGERFDIVLLHNSINHLDEEACIRLRQNAETREIYRRLFAAIAERIEPGGHLLLNHATSDNLWPRLGLKNPIAPWIEWHKHQPPEVWRELGGDVGLRHCCTRWTSLNTLGSLGRVLLGNRLGAYLTLGAFRLHMRKPRT